MRPSRPASARLRPRVHAESPAAATVTRPGASVSASGDTLPSIPATGAPARTSGIDAASAPGATISAGQPAASACAACASAVSISGPRHRIGPLGGIDMRFDSPVGPGSSKCPLSKAAAAFTARRTSAPAPLSARRSTWTRSLRAAQALASIAASAAPTRCAATGPALGAGCSVDGSVRRNRLT